MTPNTRKLLEDMRHSKANWKKRDLEALYDSFGFEIRHGKSHDIVVHRVYKTLRTTLPRHSEVLKSYVAIAVKLVDKLLVLQKEAENAKRSQGDSGKAS